MDRVSIMILCVLFSVCLLAESRYLILAPMNGVDEPILVQEVAIVRAANFGGESGLSDPASSSSSSQNDLVEESIQKRASPWSSEVRKKNYLDLSEVSAVLNEMIGRKGGGSSSANTIKMKPVRFSLGGRR